jgi:hypothetical protein
MKLNNRFLLMAASLLALAGLSACSDDDSVSPLAPPPPPPPTTTFEVTVTNLTNAQPLSPVGVVVHMDGYAPFAIGNAASAGLELLAEGGDNSEFLNEAAADMANMLTTSGAAPIGPGGSETISFTIDEADLPGTQLSLLTMLVNTNDAVSGVSAASIENMAVGDTVMWRTIAYDAGTEANSETAATIPGPAGGGEGFNAARDDRENIVKMHSGVVSQADGFMTSDLGEAHRFDNPVAQVTLTRTQ